MNWFKALGLHRAAAAYARKVPPRLAWAYGHGRTYTPGQIRAAVSALRLDPKYIALALAAYLEEPDYQALRDDLPKPLDYDQARATFLRYQPARPSSASANGEDYGSSGPYSDAGGSDHGGHGGGHH